jgi:PAS domain S-box-containing protein
VLSVNATRRHRPFTLGQVKALSILANLAATALENASLYMQVRQSEEALRQSEVHYRTLVEGSLQGIAITRRDGTRLFANTALAHMFGYERPEELVGRGIWEQVAPHEVPRVRASFDVPVPIRHEYQAVKQDGSLVWVERLASPMRRDGDSVILEACIDITERKHLETQLRQAQKMQALGTLAGGIAHDFNNILMAILGHTELAMMVVERDSAVWRTLQGVLTAGNRAKDLVKQILAFSRQTETERIPIQLHLLIKEALLLLRAALPSTITIQQSVDPKAGAVLADPTQLHQVLINLCTNAAHAMRDTGGVLEVRLEPIDVTIDSSAPGADLKAGPYVRLMVRDTGHGMTPEVMERIFEPFFTTKSPGEGTGMGLAVVHGIVTNHGGAITVESTPGQGTTFTVYLLPADGPTIAAVTMEEPVIGGNERILFVDDEDALVHVGKALLEGLGYHVVVCTSSLQALDTFRATPQDFDLVITDRTMPEITGEALIRELRQIRPDVPIVLCTGFSDMMTAEQTRALEIDAMLLKPVVARDWGLVIREVLARRATPST